MFTFILVPLYTDLLQKREYGKVSIIFAWMIFFNVIFFAYGMETTFLDSILKKLIKIVSSERPLRYPFWTSISFLLLPYCFRTLPLLTVVQIAAIRYLRHLDNYFDALVIIPFQN
jgi:hypothetical protein